MRTGVVFGTAGHVDHGKTALVRALTGVETDRLAEERERGLTIDLGFAPLDAGPDLDTGIVDVPGHEDFVKNMLAGSTGIDVLLLVVAADEGPMPQTREHLLVSRLLGVPDGIVVLNKIDRVEDDWLDLVREATREELVQTLGHADWPIHQVSSRTGAGMADLRHAIADSAARARRRAADDLFRMPVDRAFSVSGAGTVVTGTTWSGRIVAGDQVVLLPAGQGTRVRGIQVHGAEAGEVGPGHRCALALVGVDTSDAQRGSTVVGGKGWRTSVRIGARVEVPSASPRALEHGQRVRLFLGTAEVMARVRTSDRGAVAPGETGWAVLDCEEPVVARVRDRFVLRFYSPVTTIGGGQVSSLDPPRGWRLQIAEWASVLDGEAEEAVAAAVRVAGGRGLPEESVQLATGLPRMATVAALATGRSTLRIGGTVFAAEQLGEAEAAVLEHLGSAHARRRRATVEPLESVRAGLSQRFAAGLVDAAIDELAGRGDVAVAGPGIRRADHEVALTPAEKEATAALLERLAEAGLGPPAPSELAADLNVSREVLNDLLRLLVEHGDVVQVTPEIFLTTAAEEKARAIVRSVAASAPAAPGDFRDRLHLSRKYLIPLLEYMDREGVTRRTPDGRVADPP